jgi:pyrimidine-nucleoside phosphorylase
MAGPVDLIIKKRDGQVLDQRDIDTFVRGVSSGSWADYQVAAMLMAMFLRGMTPEETADLTLAMAASGEQLDLRDIPGIKVDKHSTGGVADTTTLILAPLVAACGAPVVKISGRGLGFTGGTIDKLESIPGFRVDLSTEQAVAQVKRDHLVIMSQTDNLTPADKKLYALRDVTGTIDCIPLIAASIMSKKIAAGADAIVLDVKCGNGAFMRTFDQARQLAATMVAIGKAVGRRVIAVISNMDQPLGMNIGNALEVQEAISVLKGQAGGDLLDVSLVLGAQMVWAAGLAATIDAARQLLLDRLHAGAGLEALRTLIVNQGGDPGVIDDPGLLPRPVCRRTWFAPQAGYLASIDTAAIGRIFVSLGGGRLTKNEPIDYSVGLVFHQRLGASLAMGQPMVDIYARSEDDAHSAAVQLEQACLIAENPPTARAVILDIIT